MEFDIITIVAIALALIIGFAIYYLYNRYKCSAVDEVYGLLKSIWDTYGERLEKDNPELYAELKSAIVEMDKAMEDKEITIMEAFVIAQAFIPLTKRLTKYIKEKYGA